MDKIARLRKQIDTLDSELIKTLEKRHILAKRVWVLKQKNGLLISDPKREREIVNNLKSKHLTKRFIRDVYALIFELKNSKLRNSASGIPNSPPRRVS